MLLAGLGNPGLQYEQTRHNIGFMFIDFLRQHKSCDLLKKSLFKGELYRCQSNYLLKPTTYMNLSGESIIAVKSFFKIEDVLVIHDDMDLPFGAVRFKFGGGSGGHNGIKSTDSHIGNGYWRLRLGIGKPMNRSEVVNYVLGRFEQKQLEQMSILFEHCQNAIDALETLPFEEVRTRYNVKSIDQLLA